MRCSRVISCLASGMSRHNRRSGKQINGEDRRDERPGYAASRLRTARRRGFTEPSLLYRGAQSPTPGQLQKEVNLIMSDTKNVLLIHGGFVDGSGWQGVYNLLKTDGFNVRIVQNPTISLEGDVAATTQLIEAQ